MRGEEPVVSETIFPERYLEQSFCLYAQKVIEVTL